MSELKITMGPKNRSYFANAIYNTDENYLIILKGSKWKTDSTAKRSQEGTTKDRRAELRDNGIVDENGVFTQDYKVLPENNHLALSPALGIIGFYGISLDDESVGWVTEDGQVALDYLLENGIAEEKRGAKGAKIRYYIPPSERKNSNLISETKARDIVIHGDNDEKQEKLKPYIGKNTIFYGVPGCGKSYKVKELLGADGEGSKVSEAQCKRVLFHPEYSYSDFVGQVMPQTEGERIEYKFAPGPFVEILKDAYDHPRKEYFLIIEEINRGNAPAIFGDLFQLLDRRPKKSGEEEGAKPGESEYGIYNRDILGVLNEGREEPLQEVKIPANLTLFATMNTCDQNVFTLDTAFKRRWRMQRIKNMFYADKEPFVCVIGQSGGKIGERGIIWKEFAEAVNKDILLNCNDGTAAEDKLLGAYFVNEEEIADAQVFAEKVLMYLREDVARYDKSQLFDAKYPTLDAVIDGFVRGENVFSPACGNIKALYDRVPDTATPSEEE